MQFCLCEEFNPLGCAGLKLDITPGLLIEAGALNLVSRIY